MIPRILHHVWLGPKPIPDWQQQCIELMRRTNPTWEHRLWRDDDVEPLLTGRLREIYQDAERRVPESSWWQFRSNIVRMLIVHRYGGVYADCDMQGMKPLDRLLNVEAFTSPQAPGEGISNSIIGSAPSGRFLTAVVDNLADEADQFAGKPSWFQTGNRAIDRIWRRHPEGLKLYPSRWFYPYWRKNMGDGSRWFGDAFTVHHWSHARDGKPPQLVDVRDPVVSVAITAHPKRRAWAEQLARELEVEPTWDRGRGRWDTARRAWLSYNPDATHHLVVEDDIILGQRFLEGLIEAIREVPTSPIVPFTMRYRIAGERQQRYLQSIDEGRSWFIDRQSMSSQAIVLPIADIEEMVAFADPLEGRGNDMRPRAFYEHHQVQVWHTLPSLVQHRTDENPTLAGSQAREVPRNSMFYLDGRCATDVDWTVPAIDTKDLQGVVMAKFRNVRTGGVKTVTNANLVRSYRHSSRWEELEDPVAEAVETTASEAAEPQPESSVAAPVLDQGPWPYVEVLYVGGGWFEVRRSDGKVLDRVRGKEDANRRAEELASA